MAAWDNNRDTIFAKYLFGNGTDASPIFTIYQNTTSQQYAPFVIPASGDPWVLWFGNQIGARYHTQGGVLNNVTIAKHFLIPQNLTFSQYYPSGIELTNGNIFVVGTSTQSDALTKSIFFENTTACGNDSILTQNATVNYFPPAAVLGLPSEKKVLTAWASNNTIWGRFSFENETDASDEILLAPNTFPKLNPSLALANGNPFLVYQSSQTGRWGIFGELLDTNGGLLVPEFLIFADTIDQLYPTATPLADRNILITWVCGAALCGKLYDPNIVAISDKFNVTQNTTATTSPHSVAPLTKGGAFLIWSGGGYINGRVLDPATLSSFLYPVPSPLPAPAPAPLPSPLPAPLPLSSPRPAPVPEFAFAPLPVPTSEVVPAPVPSPILTPSLFTQSSSGAGSLSSSEFSTDMLTPSSSSLLFSSSSTMLMDSSSSSPSGRTAAIIGGAAGGAAFLIIAVVVAVLVKVFCFSGENEKDEPASSASDEEDVEEKEESNSPPPPTDPDRMTLTNVTEKLTKDLTKKQRNEQYVDFARLSNAVNDNSSIELSSVQAE